MDSYQTFKTFPDRATAEDFADILKQAQIDFFIEEDSVMFDPSYANNDLQKDFRININPQDFPKANKAYDSYFATQLDNIDPDYYLFSFSTLELKEILAKSDEWGGLDYALAKKLLREKGAEISDEELQTFKEQRYNELAKPEKEKAANVLGYYFIGILFFPIGIVIGWVWGYSKKVLPDGRKVYNYTDNVRRHGKIIFTIASFLLVFVIVSKVLQRFP